MESIQKANEACCSRSWRASRTFLRQPTLSGKRWCIP